MTRQDLLNSIESVHGPFVKNGITFEKTTPDGTVIARDVEDSNIKAYLWNHNERGRDFCIDGFKLKNMRRELNFIKRLADIVKVELDIEDTIDVTDHPVFDEAVLKLEKEVRETKLVAERKSGMVEAYEKLLINRKVQIDT
jgi:hypothetical protein